MTDTQLIEFSTNFNLTLLNLKLKAIIAVLTPEQKEEYKIQISEGKKALEKFARESNLPSDKVDAMLLTLSDL